MTDPIVVDKRPTYDSTPVAPEPFIAIPLGDYLVVKRLPEPEGIIIQADIAKEKPIHCQVIAISSDLADVVPLQVGDVVLIRRFSGTEVEIGKQEYTLILIQDVLLKL